LAPGIGEIIGGSQREERLDVLDRNMTERGIDQEHYAWYGDLRRYGMVPRPASASASSAPSPTSPASPTPATASPSREPLETRGIDLYSLAQATCWASWRRAKSKIYAQPIGRYRPAANLARGAFETNNRRAHFC
jgi:hypothetical protein